MASNEQGILELNAIAPERRRVPLKWRAPGEQEPQEIMVELALPSDFGTIDHAELDRDRMSYELLRQEASLTEAQKDEAEFLLDKLVRRLVIGGPDEALKQLPTRTREAVVDDFFAGYTSPLLKLGMAVMEKADEATLARLVRLGQSSPGSSGSTAATPNSGAE